MISSHHHHRLTKSASDDERCVGAAVVPRPSHSQQRVYDRSNAPCIIKWTVLNCYRQFAGPWMGGCDFRSIDRKIDFQRVTTTSRLPATPIAYHPHSPRFQHHTTIGRRRDRHRPPAACVGAKGAVWLVVVSAYDGPIDAP